MAIVKEFQSRPVSGLKRGEFHAERTVRQEVFERILMNAGCVSKERRDP